MLVGGAFAAGLGPNFLSLTSLLEAFIVSVIIASKGVCVCVCVHVGRVEEGGDIDRGEWKDRERGGGGRGGRRR